jgi:hypothetical protein
MSCAQTTTTSSPACASRSSHAVIPLQATATKFLFASFPVIASTHRRAPHATRVRVERAVLPDCEHCCAISRGDDVLCDSARENGLEDEAGESDRASEYLVDELRRGHDARGDLAVALGADAIAGEIEPVDARKRRDVALADHRVAVLDAERRVTEQIEFTSDLAEPAVAVRDEIVAVQERGARRSSLGRRRTAVRTACANREPERGGCTGMCMEVVHWR